MEKKVFFISAIFILTFLLSTCSVFAYCSMPAVYRENGAGMDLISNIRDRRLISIKQTDHPADSWINYNLQIKNKNSDQGILVYLEPEVSQDNILPGSVLLGPGEKGNLTLNIWVRQDKDVKFRLTGVCDDGTKFDNFIRPELEVEVQSNEDITPVQGSCNLPPSGCDMNTGLYTSYFCNNTEVESLSRCVSSCCQSYGQQFDDNQAFCSIDKHACISSAGVVPTEGSIAFLCGSDQCKNEQDIMLTLRMLGWKVDGKNYKSWSYEDLNGYDIIACYEQSACNIKFNSPAYNQHFTNRKPFLEIAMSRYAYAAYQFGYVNSSNGYSGQSMFFVTALDDITEGFYNSSVNVLSRSNPKFTVIKDGYLDTINNPELKDLADSGYNPPKKQGSLFFIVNETVWHGNYAFIGWLVNYKKGELNSDGETILNRALEWLKSTTQTGEKKKIAFLCSRDDCSDRDDMDLIKDFRKWGFLVDGKSLKSWGNETSDYDLIVCRNSRLSCKIPVTSPVYSAHMNNSIPFLEIPETSKAYAAELFGIVNSTRPIYSRYSNYSIMINNSDPIVSGFSNPINIFSKKRPMVGVGTRSLISVNDIAHIFNTPVSTLFTSQSNGKYAFVGWLGTSNVQYANGNSTKILNRTINWLICGNITC